MVTVQFLAWRSGGDNQRNEQERAAKRVKRSSTIPYALVARCSLCGEGILITRSGKLYVAHNTDGTSHRCPEMFEAHVPVDMDRAYCGKCFKPMYESPDSCTCLNPLPLTRFEAGRMKDILRKLRPRAEHRAPPTVGKLLRCLLCTSRAVKAGDEVLCLKEPDHMFSCEAYGFTSGV